MAIITGTNGDDFELYGTREDDIIRGLAGSDYIRGLGGNDILYGGKGIDILWGDDVTNGPLHGNDTLDGGEGNDILIGGKGDDLYIVGAGVDFINDWEGSDTVHLKGVDFNDLGVSYIPDQGLLTLKTQDVFAGGALLSQSIGFSVQLFPGVGTSGISIERVETDDGFYADFRTVDLWKWGTNAGETLKGTMQADTILAGGGNDIVKGFGGNDKLHGGDGNDTLYGGKGADLLHGGDGSDTLFGGKGNDILIGGRDSDTLFGGAGSDTFTFTRESYMSGVDRVKDFSTAQNDKLDLSDLLQFFDPLTDAINDFLQITYNGKNAILSVDLDGKGGDVGMVQVAVIENMHMPPPPPQQDLSAVQDLINKGTIII